MADRHTVATWANRTGKHTVTLYRDAWGYGYTAPRASGSLGPLADDATAIVLLERRVNDFQPDANKTPMRRTDHTDNV
jgi:hypothetical protein